jgi:excinuclease ABC subunit A
MTVDDALDFFTHIPAVASKLETLQEVGLGYICLGQFATTLSGGEAQRIKLSKELSKRSTGRTLYILDEPTTGLHFDDIRQLLGVLTRFVDRGNTVVVIEHNPDVIKNADHIIDLGPEGGEAGGTIVAQGTPEEVAETIGSHTGAMLRDILDERLRKVVHS